MNQDLTKIKDINILYVEDDEIIRNNLYMMLKKMYGTLYVAIDGLDGLNMFKKYPNIDIIITDINMPNMDGLTMIEKIKEINPNIKTIVSTAQNDNDILIKSINLGINNFITKPIHILNLFKIIYDLYLKIKSNDIIFTKTKENNNLIDVLNTISITLELDNEFNTIKYNKKYEEMIDINKSFFNNITTDSKNLILKELENNKIFVGKITFINENIKIYTKTFIIPTKENGYLKYIIISFEDESYYKTREENKQKISLISKEKINSYSKDKEIDLLNKKIKELENMILSKDFTLYIKELKDKVYQLNEHNDQLEKDKIELEYKINFSNIRNIEKLKYQMLNQTKTYNSLKEEYELKIHDLSLKLESQNSYQHIIDDLEFKNKNLYELVEDFEKEIHRLKNFIKKQIN